MSNGESSSLAEPGVDSRAKKAAAKRLAAVEPFVPFPVAALPQPVAEFVVAAARAIGCDPSYVAMPLLAVIAAAIGTTRRIQLKRGWTALPVLWCAVIGESGTAKTPAFKLVMRATRDLQRKALKRHEKEMEQYQADVARYEKAYSAWKRSKKATDDPPEKPTAPEAERFVVSDTTVEALAPILKANPRGVLLARDELAGWLGSFDRYVGGKGGADSAHWLSMHNGEGIIVDRKTGTPRTIFVPQAAVSICGGIQPGILHRALGVEHRESGLAGRLLLTCPPSVAKRWTEADISPADEAEIARLIERLIQLRPVEDENGEPQAVVVRMTPEAKAAWRAFYNAHAEEQVDLTGELSAAWSKLEEYAARFALIVHCTRWAAEDPTLENADAVDVASMRAGIALTQWFKGEARRVYAMLSETDEDRDRRRLTEWIARKGGRVTARDVQAGCRWLREPGAAEAALEDLSKVGLGHWMSTPPAANGGRPGRVFTVHQHVNSQRNPEETGKNGSCADVDTVDVFENTRGAANRALAEAAEDSDA